MPPPCGGSCRTPEYSQWKTATIVFAIEKTKIQVNLFYGDNNNVIDSDFITI